MILDLTSEYNMKNCADLRGYFLPQAANFKHPTWSA